MCTCARAHSFWSFWRFWRGQEAKDEAAKAREDAKRSKDRAAMLTKSVDELKRAAEHSDKVSDHPVPQLLNTRLPSCLTYGPPAA